MVHDFETYVLEASWRYGPLGYVTYMSAAYGKYSSGMGR